MFASEGLGMKAFSSEAVCQDPPRSSVIVKTKPVNVAPTAKDSVTKPTRIMVVVFGSLLWAIRTARAISPGQACLLPLRVGMDGTHQGLRRFFDGCASG
jgi:hypothetical protein